MTRSAFAFAALIACFPCFAQTYKVQLFDAAGGQAYITGVGASGEVVGYVMYVGEMNFSSFGFTYSSGHFEKVQSPLAGDNGTTQLYGVNAFGDIVGYILGTSLDHACFVLSAAGTYKYFGEGTSADFPNLQALGINSIGVVVGASVGSTGTQGFKLAAGKYAYFSTPGAQSTTAYGINRAGTIVGSTSAIAKTNPQGFLYNGASFTIVSYPNSVSTVLSGINDLGTAAGYYQNGEPTDAYFGFTYTGGMFTSVSFPQFQSFQILGINDLGVIYGTYVNQNAQRPVAGGFVAIPTQPGEEPTTERIELKFN